MLHVVVGRRSFAGIILNKSILSPGLFFSICKFRLPLQSVNSKDLQTSDGRCNACGFSGLLAMTIGYCMPIHLRTS